MFPDEEARAERYRLSLVNRHNAYVARARALVGNQDAYIGLVERWMPVRQLPLPPPREWDPKELDLEEWQSGVVWRNPPPDWGG